MSDEIYEYLTVNVDHHGGTTLDPHLIWDEVCKRAYRMGKTNGLVASCHISDLRKERDDLKAENKRLRKALEEIRKDAQPHGRLSTGCEQRVWSTAKEALAKQPVDSDQEGGED